MKHGKKYIDSCKADRPSKLYDTERGDWIWR